jgi:hypothetical protein
MSNHPINFITATLVSVTKSKNLSGLAAQVKQRMDEEAIHSWSLA